VIDWNSRLSSIDGSEFGMLTTEHVFLAWDHNGAPLDPVTLDYDMEGPVEMFQSFSAEWIVVRYDWGAYAVFDRDGEKLREVQMFDHIWHRFDRAGRYALGWAFGTDTSLLDTTDWSVQPFTEDLGEGLVRDAGFSPSADLVALGIQGGPMRVFTVPDGELVARIPIDNVVSIHWVDDLHIAVGTRDGLWTVVTLDIDELQDLAGAQLVRDFSPDECRTYRIESCAP
jgi:hypothetical protein